MLGNIIKLWIVSAEKVKTSGYNCAGTRTGFQLKDGCTWTEISLLRDTTKSSGTVSFGNSDFKLLASSVRLNTMGMVGRRYACKYLTNTGATYIVGDGRAYYLSTEYTSGKQPGDMVGVNITLLGSSRYANQWLVEIPAGEVPVDPPVDPPYVNPLVEHFDTLDNVKVYYWNGSIIELQLGQVVDGASFTQPYPSVIRLQIGAHSGSLIVVRYFPSVKDMTNVNVKLTGVSNETPWFFEAQGGHDIGDVCLNIKALTVPGDPWSGSLSDKFIPKVGEIAYRFTSNAPRYYGVGVELWKYTSEGNHYFDIDFMLWTFV